MSSGLVRQWHLLQKMPPFPRKVATSTLVEALRCEGIDVGIRTVQRDLVFLSRVFPIVQDDRSKPFGWSWSQYDSGQHFPGFSPSVAMALLMAQKFLKPVFPASHLQLIENHFKQAENLLNALNSEALLDWQNKIHIQDRGVVLQPVTLKTEVSASVYEAVLLQQVLDVRYFSKSSDSLREMRIWPLALVVSDRMTYVIAKTDRHAHYVQLALHRFSEVETTDDTFEYPADFVLAQYLADGQFSVAASEKSLKTIEVVLRFEHQAGSHLLETPLNDSQQVEDTNEGLVVSAKVANTKEFRWWLLGFGEKVEVLEPPSLRTEMQATLQAALALYE